MRQTMMVDDRPTQSHAHSAPVTPAAVLQINSIAMEENTSESGVCRTVDSTRLRTAAVASAREPSRMRGMGLFTVAMVSPCPGVLKAAKPYAILEVTQPSN